MKYISLAGAVIFKKENDTYKYLLVKNQNGKYVFPIGEFDRDAYFYNSADKTIKNQLGLKLNYNPYFCKTISYETNKDLTRLEYYYMANLKDNTLIVNNNISLFTYEEANNELRDNKLVELLFEVNYHLTHDMKICCMFEKEDANKAFHDSKLDFIKNYGERCGNIYLHVDHDGGRTLNKCKKCGAYILHQWSEIYMIDKFYDDYVPVANPEHADLINHLYGGYGLEFDYPYKKLFYSDGNATWHQ